MTGDRTIISDNISNGSGMNFGGLSHLTIDEDNNRAFVHDDNSGGVLIVDLTTGARSKMPGGLGVGTISSISYDSEHDRLAAIDRLNDRIYVTNVVTGAGSFLSGPGASGVAMGSPTNLLVDIINNRYLVNDVSYFASYKELESIVAVNRTTGERSIAERVGFLCNLYYLFTNKFGEMSFRNNGRRFGSSDK